MAEPAPSRRDRIRRLRRLVAAGAVVVLLAAFAAVAAWGVQPAAKSQTPSVDSQSAGDSQSSGDGWGWSGDDESSSVPDQDTWSDAPSGQSSQQSSEPPMSTHAS